MRGAVIVVTEQAAAHRSRLRRTAVLSVTFGLVATVIALFRFRLSPLYPKLNDLNSDFFVYTLVGNSWAHGEMPYRDIYDVKGPSLFLLTRAFAELSPWSTWPALVFLALLAGASLALAYAIARRYLSIAGSVASAIASALLIYLSLEHVNSSFTGEELAVPGVLLVIWLTLRTIEGEHFVARWWILNGAAFAALFWCKYQVVAPWGGLLIALMVLAWRGMIDREHLKRVIRWNTVGFAVVTAAVLVWYLPVLSQVFHAYFISKDVGAGWLHEPIEQARFVGELWSTEPIAMTVLTAGMALLLLRAVTLRDRAATALAIGWAISFWASISFVRHPMNPVVPLSFLAAALPMAIALAPLRRPARALLCAGVLVMAVLACVPSWTLSTREYRLFDGSAATTRCSVTGEQRVIERRSVSAAFIERAQGNLIMSLGTLFAARTAVGQRQVDPHRFAFTDITWAHSAGADRVQEQYLRDGTYRYVWISVRGIDPDRPFLPQLLEEDALKGQATPGQASALIQGYHRVLSCGSNVLMERNS
ncbi:glycosyltransferase family 39 protein [Dermacoccaceae bacterium W4C1]